MTTGERIAELRKQYSLTQPMLAERMAVSQSTVTSWENDRRSVNNDDLIKLAKLFNVTTDYLLGIHHAPKDATEKDIKDLHRILDQGQLTYREEPISEEAKEAVQSLLEGYYWRKGRDRMRRREKKDGEE